MADLFGLNQDQYLTDDQRVLAADTSRAFLSADEALQRTLSRYSLPQAANAANKLALGRAQTFANATNRMRMDVDAQTRYGGYPSGRAPQGSRGASRAAGIARLAPLIFGQDKYNQIIRGGVLPYIRDIFGNPVPAMTPPITEQGTYPMPFGQPQDDLGLYPQVMEPASFPEPVYDQSIDYGLEPFGG
jgi:hypothetical protein